MVHMMVESTTSMLRTWESKIESHGGIAEIGVDEYLSNLAADIISRACFQRNYHQGEEIFLKLRTLRNLLCKELMTGIPGLRIWIDVTTALATSWSFMLLAAHPDWQARVRAEVLEICGNEPPDADMLQSMKVNPDIWGPDVHKFNPERFSNGILEACQPPQAYMPFGMGPNICVGQQLAMAEFKVILALSLSKFCFSLSPPYQHSPVYNLVTVPEHGAKEKIGQPQGCSTGRAARGNCCGLSWLGLGRGEWCRAVLVDGAVEDGTTKIEVVEDEMSNKQTVERKVAVEVRSNINLIDPTRNHRALVGAVGSRRTSLARLGTTVQDGCGWEPRFILEVTNDLVDRD
ncbi:hypothetical protein D8674_042270 [Pyrus ussuriensis x Pyrus communis]|uniref:Uncharacterized protein n=1 Tax=Pyrus ussuriensis x Pyrus communis TaxID=2448454 RepID=A0A5N5G3P0_9ROSA|nr:hypothetical protein D8674_042270 [Pyrus ussuriensis x Pyrus communis]